MSKSEMGKVIPIRRSAMKSLDRANAQVETAFNIIAILRRRLSQPKEGMMVIVEFATDAEAQTFQNLVHKLPKRRKRP